MIQHREGQRTGDLDRRVLHLADDARAGWAALAQVAHDVLGHDDGAVDDDPEVDRAQREQVRGDPAQVHEDEREQTARAGSSQPR